jgi:hypothetical protein
LNHLVLEHLSGVKGGCPLEEAYYLILSLFKALSTFPEVFICYIDVWFLTWEATSPDVWVRDVDPQVRLLHPGQAKVWQDCSGWPLV